MLMREHEGTEALHHIASSGCGCCGPCTLDARMCFANMCAVVVCMCSGMVTAWKLEREQVQSSVKAMSLQKKMLAGKCGAELQEIAQAIVRGHAAELHNRLVDRLALLQATAAKALQTFFNDVSPTSGLNHACNEVPHAPGRCAVPDSGVKASRAMHSLTQLHEQFCWTHTQSTSI